MNNKLIRALVVGVSVLSMPFASAFAATTQYVTVKQPVYLRSGPHFYSRQITLENKGMTLTVEPGSTSAFWHVVDQHGKFGYVDRSMYYTGPTSSVSTSTSVSTGALSSVLVPNASAASTQLPPSVTYDASVHAIAPPSDTNQQKFNAVLQVATAQLGTRYVWGTSKDRGQNSFDCSNFTAYVYHHALGYKMSGASQTQYHSVGWAVSKASMQPGDLLVFNQGGHVGIYIGNGTMIEEGGGLGKVGYLKVSPGSYWYNHLTVVKRMY